MKVKCILQEICEHEDVSLAELHAATGIHVKSLKNLLQDEGWRVDRDNYESLLSFAFDHGYATVFQTEHHPIWDTFHRNAQTSIIRGQIRRDVDIEQVMTHFVENIGGKPEMVVASRNIAAVKKAMKERNCIFIGSPKSNPSTEIALCSLYGAIPFDGSAANRKRLPLQILGVEPPPKTRSALLVTSRKHGFEIGTGPSKQFVDVHRLPQDEYDHWFGEASKPDAAVVVVCRSPLKTTKRVTTILVLGYSSLATESAARQLTHGELPLDAAELAEPGSVHVLKYEFQFRKTHATQGDPRREIHDPPGSWSVLR